MIILNATVVLLMHLCAKQKNNGPQNHFL